MCGNLDIRSCSRDDLTLYQRTSGISCRLGPTTVLLQPEVRRGSYANSYSRSETRTILQRLLHKMSPIPSSDCSPPILMRDSLVASELGMRKGSSWRGGWGASHTSGCHDSLPLESIAASMFALTASTRVQSAALREYPSAVD